METSGVRSAARLSAAAFSAVLLFLTGCSAEPPEQINDALPIDVEADGPTVDAAEQIDAEWVAEVNAEWDALTTRGWGFDTRPDADLAGLVARLDEEHRRQQDFLVDCMAGYGLTYQPVDRVFRELSAGVLWSVHAGTREFAELYGSGVVLQYEAQRELAEPVDPNDATLAAMSEAERDAWDSAYWGPANEFGIREGGCLPRAQDGASPVPESSPFAELEELIRSADSLRPDPRVFETYDAWNSCMVDRGHGAMFDPVNDGQGKPQNPGDAFAWPGFQWALLTHEHDGDVPAEERDAFLEWEFAFAQDDYQCRDLMGTRAIQDLVRAEQRAAFLDEHRDEMEAWASFMEDFRAEAH